jgi:hypothetical protein
MRTNQEQDFTNGGSQPAWETPIHSFMTDRRRGTSLIIPQKLAAISPMLPGVCREIRGLMGIAGNGLS